MPAVVNRFLKNIVDAYNAREREAARADRRKPELLPHISAHTLRRTGCTRMGEAHMNPKVMQYIMGHSSSQVTMDVYNKVTGQEMIRKEFEHVAESGREQPSRMSEVIRLVSFGEMQETGSRRHSADEKAPRKADSRTGIRRVGIG